MPLIHREAELRILERGLANATAKEGGMVVVSGEPGIGKTSLLRELAERADRRGFIVVHVSSLPQRLPDQELVWQRMWRGLCGRLEVPRVVSVSASSQEFAEPNVYGVRNWGAVQGWQGAPDVRSVAALSAWIVRLLSAVSQDCPVLLAVDDIHHADERSVELLGCLSHSLDRLPVLFALACSPSRLVGHAQADGTLETVAAHGSVMDIGPLNEDATRQLLGQITGVVPEPHLVRLVWHLTGGNPRFILECEPIINELSRVSALVHCKAEIRVPSVIRIAIKERLKLISPGAKQVLEIGTLFPNAFNGQLLSEVADLDEAETYAALVELQSAGLIRAITDRTYNCSHGFTKELLYQELPVPRRLYLHRRIASALEAHASSHVGAKGLEIVYHLARSGERRLVDRALRYAQLAGSQLASIRDFAMAAEVYSLALNAIESEPGFDPREMCKILMALAEVQSEAGQIDDAQRSFCRAATLAQDLGDTESLVRIALGMPDLGWPQAESPNEAAIMLAEQSLGSVPKDTNEKLLLTARLAAELSYFRGQRSRSEDLFDQATAMERSLVRPDDKVSLELRLFRDRNLRQPDLVEQRSANADQMIDMARKAADTEALFVAVVAKMSALSEIGDAASIQTHFALLQQAATLADRPKYRIVLLSMRASRALREGKLDVCTELWREAHEVANANGLKNLAERCWPCMAVPMREQGRLAELLPVAERINEAQSHSYTPQALLCWLLFELDHLAQARAHLDYLAEEFATLKQSPYSLATAALLSEVAAGLKILPHAGTLYDLLLPFKSHYVILGATLTSFGSVSHYLGKLALTLSRDNQAVEHFEEAINFARKSGERTWTAYSLAELAKALLIRRGTGDRERAATILAAVGAEAAELKMQLLAKQIGQLTSREGFDRERDSNVSLAPSNPAILITDQRNIADRARPLSQSAACLQQNDAGWELSFEGRTVQLKELRGLTLIAHLLSHPNEAISARDLAFLGKSVDLIANGARSADLGPVLDDNAKKAYRARVQELQEEMECARSSGDEEAALTLEQELCFITREIARGVGLFGRDRKIASDTERARVRVTNSIKFAIAKIAEHQTKLGPYLQRTIRTGSVCSYIPETGAEIVWDL